MTQSNQWQLGHSSGEQSPSSCRGWLGFNPRPGFVGFVMGQVTIGTGSSASTSVFFCVIISLVLDTYSSVTDAV